MPPSREDRYTGAAAESMGCGADHLARHFATLGLGPVPYLFRPHSSPSVNEEDDGLSRKVGEINKRK